MALKPWKLNQDNAMVERTVEARRGHAEHLFDPGSGHQIHPRAAKAQLTQTQLIAMRLPTGPKAAKHLGTGEKVIDLERL
jgi:hypothetical protein